MSPTNALTETIERAAVWIAASKHTVVLTGAGVSKESGIPTFRDALDGLWARYAPGELATPEAFARNPQLVWDWYAYRRETAEQCKPNPAHTALVELAKLLPKLIIVTQNVDRLHQQAGSTDVIELHGNLYEYRCSRNCQGDPTMVEVLDYLAHTEARSGTVPTCPHCGANVRPAIIWFGEALPYANIERAFAEAQACDLMLVIGTSGLVNPAARLPEIARMKNAVIVDVNPQPDALASIVDYFLQDAAGAIMPRLVKAIQVAK